MTEQLTVRQCAPDELWYPGLHLDAEYPVPTDAELTALWETYEPAAPAHTTREVYGVYSEPKNDVRAVASVDLCEVVRDSGMGLDEVVGMLPQRRSAYSRGSWFEITDTQTSVDYERSVVVSGIRAIMHSGLVRPVEHIEAIGSFLRNWRAQGVYVVANTSTLPGCETGTIQHTFARDLPGCFDALVLPRNHDGKGSITKARALGMLASEAGIELAAVPFVHIDDAPHHIQGFQDLHSTHATMRLFAPEHEDNHTIADDIRCDTPLEAFIGADRHFRERGIVR